MHLAESLSGAVAGFSRWKVRSHRVPGPRQDPDGFAAALGEIVAREGIDRLIPTCEEGFWGARTPSLPALLETRARLARVHHKGRFVRWAQEVGLAVPETRLAEDRDQLAAAIGALGGPERVVVKPAWSRFATNAHVQPDAQTLAGIAPTVDDPWVVQAFVPGPIACTWGVAHGGRLTVHTAYRAAFTAGAGSSVHFEWLDDPQILDWVRAFAAGTGWTGQLAFDFVLTGAGPVAIECNPRLTSGVHLLRDGRALLAALTDPEAELVTPAAGASAQVMAGMLLYGLPRAARRGEMGAWWRAFRSAREVSWDRRDPLPFVLQPLAIVGVFARAARVGEGLLDATTWDIRWNGEGEGGEGESGGGR